MNSLKATHLISSLVKYFKDCVNVLFGVGFSGLNRLPAERPFYSISVSLTLKPHIKSWLYPL